MRPRHAEEGENFCAKVVRNINVLSEKGTILLLHMPLENTQKTYDVLPTSTYTYVRFLLGLDSNVAPRS